MDSWGYLSGLLRAEKVHALTNNEFIAFAEVIDSDSLLKSLEDTIYGSLFQGRALKEFDSIFNEYYQKKFQEIREIAPCPIITNVHALKTDLNNIKLCYKAKLTQKEISWVQLSEEGTISPEKMFSIVENELWNELPFVVGQAIINLGDKAKNNIRHVDFIIDRVFYAYRLEILEEAMSYEPNVYKDLVDLYRKEVDCENIKNILRAKKMRLEKEDIADIIIPGGYISYEFFLDYANLGEEDIADIFKDTVYGEIFNKGISVWLATRSCTVLEKQIDEYLLEEITKLSYYSTGPAVVEDTLRSLQIEIKNLKLIIIGKINSMSIEEIRERVRNVRV